MLPTIMILHYKLTYIGNQSFQLCMETINFNFTIGSQRKIDEKNACLHLLCIVIKGTPASVVVVAVVVVVVVVVVAAAAAAVFVVVT